MTTSFFLVKWLYQAMDWVYRQLTSLFSGDGWVVVLTILLFTLAIKLLTVFSDIKSRKSSIQMQQIQPEIDKLKKKYGNDPQKLNTEQRKLMKERGVSTFGGCLPMLIMLPLLFMFFEAFRAWSNQESLKLMIDINNGVGVQTFQSYKFLWITNIWRPDNLKGGSTLMQGSEFWSTFAATNNVKNFLFYNNPQYTDTLNQILYKLHFFTMTTGENGAIEYVLANDGGAAFQAAYQNFVLPITSSIGGSGYETMSNGYAILPILAGATTFLSSWIMQKSQPKPAKQTDDKNDPAAQTQNMSKWMMYLMPLMSVFFCYQYNATFAFYWIFSNVFSLAVTLILNATVFKKMQTQTVEVVK